MNNVFGKARPGSQEIYDNIYLSEDILLTTNTKLLLSSPYVSFKDKAFPSPVLQTCKYSTVKN